MEPKIVYCLFRIWFNRYEGDEKQLLRVYASVELANKGEKFFRQKSRENGYATNCGYEIEEMALTEE